MVAQIRLQPTEKAIRVKAGNTTIAAIVNKRGVVTPLPKLW